MSELFRPSNVTTADAFMHDFCHRCVKFSHCMIPARTMTHDVEDPLYPTEWISDDQGTRCTTFVQRGFRHRHKHGPRQAAAGLPS